MTPDSSIVSYINHGGKWWMVSTIERDSSAAYRPGRYNETIAWDYDRDTQGRGEQIYMGEANTGSLYTHETVCRSLYLAGKPPELS